jgi:hypothetical protein
MSVEMRLSTMANRLVRGVVRALIVLVWPIRGGAGDVCGAGSC